MSVIKVLFICHGNICRSPMAEFVFKKKLDELGLADLFYVASAATSTEEIWNGVGNPVYPPAREELAKHGISCQGKRAMLLKKSDYGAYDYLIGMDHANIRNMHRILGGDPEQKIHLMLEFAGLERGIADPWYSGNFGETYRDVDMGCDGFLAYLKEHGEI
ncbi:MAG: low molecular weight protein-tyrosine-phosphatase [Eubacteriales bacterium]|nr:low molecular weight phosphotyrosine protein phosphatase [Lachnospiraceae bacterium]MDO5126186.1 low molecular weight protein-tyrosine-phosphatase [Eubacteriales bacterium]